MVTHFGASAPTVPTGHVAPALTPTPTDSALAEAFAPLVESDAGRWPVVEDPDRWRSFVMQVIDQHHRVTVPGVGAEQCSCGRPFMLCPIGPLAHQLLG
ncbi:hypothetical protein [Actinocatenispora rupis]|uniref:Uncharacterized protein n=1 Tax=Actinocatenispora rupis TaxID=519421 RepID=A0A8J3NBF8_9ACTN|nr:hypothetical protein [Actinocatenispora rupis]GID10745.1 hypothetical protein Aru02nite_16340 [Actinocatenispora rupis]